RQSASDGRVLQSRLRAARRAGVAGDRLHRDASPAVPVLGGHKVTRPPGAVHDGADGCTLRYPSAPAREDGEGGADLLRDRGSGGGGRVGTGRPLRRQDGLWFLSRKLTGTDRG